MTKSTTLNIGIVLCVLAILFGLSSILIACHQADYNKRYNYDKPTLVEYAYDTTDDTCPYEYGECPSALCRNHIFEIHSYETSDSLFFKYEVLLPDYVHTDTLIVMRPDELNRLIQAEWIESDQDIADILSATTVKYYDWLYRDLALKP